MKFVRPTTRELYVRHPGPWTLNVAMRVAGREISRWQRQLYVRPEDVEAAVRQWFAEPTVTCVAVFSEVNKYYVTSYSRTTPTPLVDPPQPPVAKKRFVVRRARKEPSDDAD